MGTIEQLVDKVNEQNQLIKRLAQKLDKLYNTKEEESRIIGIGEIADITGFARTTIYKKWPELVDQGYPIKKMGKRIEAVKGDLEKYVLNRIREN